MVKNHAFMLSSYIHPPLSSADTSVMATFLSFNLIFFTYLVTYCTYSYKYYKSHYVEEYFLLITYGLNK